MANAFNNDMNDEVAFNNSADPTLCTATAPQTSIRLRVNINDYKITEIRQYTPSLVAALIHYIQGAQEGLIIKPECLTVQSERDSFALNVLSLIHI